MKNNIRNRRSLPNGVLHTECFDVWEDLLTVQIQSPFHSLEVVPTLREIFHNVSNSLKSISVQVHVGYSKLPVVDLYSSFFCHLHSACFNIA